MKFSIKVILKYLIIFFPVALYINFKFFTYYFLLLFFCTLLYLVINRPIIRISVNFKWLILPLFFLIHLLFLLNTSNIKSGLFDLEVKASMFFLPLIFLTLKEDENIFNKLSFDLQKKILFYTSIGIIIFLSLSAIVDFIKTNNLYLLFYVYLARFYHPSYLSLYIILGLISYFILKKESILIFIFTIIFILFIFLLSSKSGLLSMFILLIFMSVYFFIKKKYKLTLLFSLLVLLFISLIYLFSKVKFNERIYYEKNAYNESIKIIKNKEEDFSSTYASTPLRILVWETSIDLLKQNWLFGVGTGDIKDELLKKYKEKNIIHALEQKLNAHNQFLETLLAQGIIGFIGLIIVFMLLFYYNIKAKNFLFLCFTLIIFINFLFESMLNTQSGVTLFSYFYVLTLINYELEKR